MQPLSLRHIDKAKQRIASGFGLDMVIPNELGGATVDGGFWRVFGSAELGPYGIEPWNAPDLWKHAWAERVPPTCWGEDVFGNQIIVDADGNLFLWNHEDGSMTSTGLPLFLVLESALAHGLGWLDFYLDGSHALAKSQLDVLPSTSHLHWIQPRIMGGRVEPANLTRVERVQHMIGHGNLWSQLRSAEPGSRVVALG